MRREFEENEEESKELEKNLDVQDEIDDETFRKILKEEFIEREKQIEEALFADEDCEDLVFTEEEVKDSYQELLRRFEKEKKKNAEISEELVPDEKLVRRMTAEKKSEAVYDYDRESAESEEYETSNPKIVKIRSEKTDRRLHRLGRAVGMAVVAVACVFAASMTSEANRTYLVNSVRIWSGDDTKTVVDNDDSNEASSKNEENAIAEIEQTLEVKMPILYYRPYGFEFSDYKIDKDAGVAWIEYKYTKNSIMLYIDKQKDITASKINSVYGDEDDITMVDNSGVSVAIKKNYDGVEENPSYSAEWNEDNTLYLLTGKLKLEEIKKIIEEMKI